MNSAPQLRTLLILGRVSNLPTVWSNCLAGWWLGGGGNFWKLPFLFFGVSLLDTGGISPSCPPRSAVTPHFDGVTGGEAHGGAFGVDIQPDEQHRTARHSDGLGLRLDFARIAA